MTIISAYSGRRRQSGGAYPWEPKPANYNTIPTSDGSGVTIHPSVVDMAARTGQPTWNGYRWWMVNSPYPQNNATLENPEIFGSNDGIHWDVPPGVVNPIDPYPGLPGEPWYHSDPELVWDPEGARLVAYWRRSRDDTKEQRLYIASSTDGSTWTHHGQSNVAGYSPSVVRVAAGDWRIFFHASTTKMFSSSSPLGPWANPVELSRPDGLNHKAWHGDMELIDGVWYHVGSTGAGDTRQMQLSVGIDPSDIRYWAIAAVLPWKAYRPTITDGRLPGTIDVWVGEYTMGNGCAYTTIPKSAWLDALGNS